MQSPNMDMVNIQNTLGLLMDSANAKHGRTFDRTQIVDLARYVMLIETASNQLYARATVAEKLVNAYVTEYGATLLDELAPAEWFEGEEVVDGEIVEAGRDDENVRVYPPFEEEE